MHIVVLHHKSCHCCRPVKFIDNSIPHNGIESRRETRRRNDAIPCVLFELPVATSPRPRGQCSSGLIARFRGFPTHRVPRNSTRKYHQRHGLACIFDDRARSNRAVYRYANVCCPRETPPPTRRTPSRVTDAVGSFRTRSRFGCLAKIRKTRTTRARN